VGFGKDWRLGPVHRSLAIDPELQSGSQSQEQWQQKMLFAAINFAEHGQVWSKRMRKT